MTRNNFELMTDMESIGEILGAIAALEHGLDGDYIDALIVDAHRVASDQFDVTAAATAHAGYMSHMFEYGVPGITHGPPRHQDPTAPTARLWMHDIVGGRGTFNVNFLFRPAATKNPNQTVARTGVADKYIKKLSRRKYIFYNRAVITETGKEVTITSKKGRLLFIPFYGEPPRGNKANKRGYAMVPGPVTVTPGRTSAGQFTAFWNSWWDTEGTAVVQNHAETRIRADVQEILQTAQAMAEKQRLEHISAVDVNSRANQSMSRVIKNVNRKSSKRKARKKRS